MTIAAATAVTLLVRPAVAQQVTYDYDRATDFTAFHSYAWVEGNPVQDDLTHRRIVAAVDSQLAGRGLERRGLDQHPDVVVVYHAGVTRSVKVTGYGSGWGVRPALGRTGTARSEEVLTGMLAVEILEPKTGMVLWHGLVSRDLDLQANPEKRDENIQRAVMKLFRHYPTRK